MNRQDLFKCRDIELELKSAQEIYEMKFARVTKETQTISDMPKAIGKINYDLEELIDFYSEKIKKKQDEEKELIFRLERQFECMADKRYVSILRYYYIGGLTIEKVAEKIGYETKYTNKLKTFAIEDFEKYDTK